MGDSVTIAPNVALSYFKNVTNDVQLMFEHSAYDLGSSGRLRESPRFGNLILNSIVGQIPLS